MFPENDAVGVPDKTPPEDNDIPDGRVPEVTLQVIVASPVAVNVVDVYATFTEPLGRDDGPVIVGGVPTGYQLPFPMSTVSVIRLSR